MNIKNKTLWQGALLGSALSLSSCTKQQHETNDKLNFVIIMADDVSAVDFSCYGNKDIQTPNIDRLAQNGLQFHTCWSTPLSMPSRVQIMTGRYASSTGWYGNSFKPAGDPPYGIEGQPGYDLGEDELFFSELFKEEGYKTAISGKWHVEDYPEWETFKKDYGYDEYCLWGLPDTLPPEHKDYAKVKDASGPFWGVGDRGPFWQPAIIKNGKLGPTGEDDYGPDYFTAFVNRFIKENHKNPFMVYYPMNLAHNWWYSPVSEKTRWGTFGPVPELDSAGNKTGRRTPVGQKYAIEYLDHLVGKIVQTIDSLGILNNTVILFTTDNGSPGKGKAHIESENGFRVPMIIHCPALISEGKKSMDYVQLADVFPTIAELAGIELPDSIHFDGVSFKPVIDGKGGKRDYLYSYLNWKHAFKYNDFYLDGNDSLWRCIRTSEWKLSYINVTDSLNDPKVSAALDTINNLKKRYPAPDTTSNPMYERYKRKQKIFHNSIKSITKK